VPNDKFWGKKPQISKITAIFSQDVNTAITAFQNKEADVMLMGMTPDQIVAAEQDEYLKQSTVPFIDYTVYQFWVSPWAPMDDVHVRRAFSMAIDRETLCQVLGGGRTDLYKPLWLHTTAQLGGCLDQRKAAKGLAFDPAKAKEELAMSAYKDTIQDMEINIPYWGWENPALLPTVQKMLQDNLGLKNVKIRTEKITDWNNPPFPCHMWANGQGDHQPDPLFLPSNMIQQMPAEPLAPDAKFGLVTAPYVPELKELRDKAQVETDEQKRCELIGQIIQMWADVALSIDTHQQSSAILVAPWVKGFKACCGAGVYYTWLDPGMQDVVVEQHS